MQGGKLVKRYDYLIVGGGAGGAALAHFLSKSTGGIASIAIAEKGRVERVGRLSDCFRYYDVRGMFRMPLSSIEGITIWQSCMAGGSTVIACGNIARCLDEELQSLGVDLSEHFAECEKEIGPAPIDESLLGTRSHRIREAADNLGYAMNLMPKGILTTKCRKCGLCVFGCPYGAKWTSLDFIRSAKASGCVVQYNNKIEAVLHKGNRVQGVQLSNGEVISSANVIVAAGGIHSALLLQKSGITNAGSKLFCDLLVNIYGRTRAPIHDKEPVMSLVKTEFYNQNGFILSPYIGESPAYRFLDAGVRSALRSPDRTMGMMVKIRDENTGIVFKDGRISKKPTTNDIAKLNMGIDISKQILAEAGAGDSMIISKIHGAHPGGTCALGSVVDSNLQTEIQGLYVCDASVLPVSPGFPPILTISALAHYLSTKLTA